MPITSSSISSSDPLRWRDFAQAFLAAGAIIFVALIALAVVLDPYDAGRFALLKLKGVPEQGPRTANASRGRDPAFDAAIIGNSHIQLVSPQRLAEATGVPFVSLIVPATGPKEQLLLLDYFLRNRQRPVRAIVMGVDSYWCTPDPELKNWKPFPFWLYDASPSVYLAGLVRYDTLEKLTQRLQHAAGLLRRPLARPDGYWDYESYRTWRAEIVGPDLAQRQTSSILNETGRFPAFVRLAATLAELPARLPVVIVRPPAYVTSLPEPGSRLEGSEAACRATLQQVVANRSRTALIDWRDDRPANRAIENYLDHTHYRASLARALEAEIAQALSRMSTE
jgi:hypothetical protein